VSIARSRGKEREIEADIERVMKLFDEFPRLRKILSNPTISSEKRRAAVEEIARTMGVDDVVVNFLGVLVERGRIAFLDGLLEAYREELASLEGKVRVKVVAARDPSSSILEKLTRALEVSLHKKVILQVEVDRSLIGGFVVRIGDQVIDGSLKGKVNRLREEMVRGWRWR